MIVLTGFDDLDIEGVDKKVLQDPVAATELLDTIIKTLSEAYNYQASDPESSMGGDGSMTSVIFGALDPEKLLESIHNWVGEIQKGFVRALSQVYSPDINPEDLPVDDTDTYELQKAARELDNNWFSYSNHGVYLENDQGYPYFRVIPNEEQVAKIEAHPEKYFILQVYVK